MKVMPDDPDMLEGVQCKKATPTLTTPLCGVMLSQTLCVLRQNRLSAVHIRPLYPQSTKQKVPPQSGDTRANLG